MRAGSSQARVERGRVDVSGPALVSAGHAAAADVGVDHALARAWVGEARALRDALDLTGDVSLTWILERPGVVRLEEVDAGGLSRVARRGAGAGRRARRPGGAAGRGGRARWPRNCGPCTPSLASTVAQVAERLPAAVARRKERLRERMRALLGDALLDEGRLATEVAVWAERTDISEELARLRAHLDQFALTLDKGGPVGRLFDFLIQEMNREVNTVASKADDLELSQAAIGAKGTLEKMREQVQNLE